MMEWKVAAASARGTSHVREQLPCQDSFFYKTSPGWLCAVVSDGAGSARYSDKGSWLLANVVVETLYKRFNEDPESQNDVMQLRQQIEQAIVLARDKLAESIAQTNAAKDREDDNKNAATLSDYHATLVGVIVTPGVREFFHIGDGCAVAIAGNAWDQAVVSEPHNGRYANETYFFTMDQWRDYLRFQTLPDTADLLLLMSDGAMGFVMGKGQRSIERGFVEPVDKFLSGVDGKKGSDALAATLDNPKTYSITTDDKTLLWARVNA